MCLIIAGILFFAGYSFLEQGYNIQGYGSFIFGAVILGYFIYRVSKNAKCFFSMADSSECRKNKEDTSIAKKNK
ncbi:MAG: hypothetical protein JXQ67_06205 [Campylobacterales bacterium]|nr:hypothetical protein [Campylobacterales bacterium]